MPPGNEPDLYDRLRRRVLWAMPTGLYVVGSTAGDGASGDAQGDAQGDAKRDAGQGRWNLMTANLVVQVATEPKLVAVAVETGAVTRRFVDASDCFAVSLLGRESRAVVRRFVKPVRDVELDGEGRVERLAGEPVVLAPSGAPVLRVAVAWLDCHVRHRVELGSHIL
ncbi:MAG TPA: flavin reductase family protein, partial [Acidimicrobiales bacterium]|nr:flavin reductase family protein [Acidimicrobiales bacterium]